ncbi:MAG TPA: IclR family transcriptional regulator [Devosiaceae bacterium]|nr:IclR family transcriptional regulator [Devosiaceae bacterium]
MSNIDADLPPVPSGDLTARYSIRAVDRAFDILDLLARSEGGASLMDISESIGLPKSSVFRYLSTLERRGHVIRDSEEVFRLGAGRNSMRPRDVARLGGAAVLRMQELCRRFDETINLGTLDGHRVAYLEVVESPKAMRFAATRGGSDPIHSSALGKAIAATLADNEVRGILSVEGMTRMTDRTITTPGEFLQELSEVRGRGYSIDDGENEDGGRCVAVSLPYPPRAALSLSAPEARLPREQLPEVAATLRRAAEDIAQEVRGASA